MRRTINLGIYTTEGIIVPLCRGWWRFILLWSGCTPVYLYELMTSWRYTCLPVRADDVVKVWCCEVDVHVFTCTSWWHCEGVMLWSGCTRVYLYELMTSWRYTCLPVRADDMWLFTGIHSDSWQAGSDDTSYQVHCGVGRCILCSRWSVLPSQLSQ